MLNLMVWHVENKVVMALFVMLLIAWAHIDARWLDFANENHNSR
jgi:hypothetical protein